MISSPFLTEKGERSPFSRRLPSPRLTTLPRLGFSLALSGRTMPDLVLVSASTRLTRILSPRGRSLVIAVAPKNCCQLSVVRCQLLILAVIRNGRRTNGSLTIFILRGLSFTGPFTFVMPSQQSCQRVEQLVEIDGLGQDAEHVHAEGFVEQMGIQLLSEQDRGRDVLAFASQIAHQLD